ncbi:hypothetical protein IW492_04010 [Enterococcus sp. BWB1-3]|nr:hypothetical protein [Enterococcus sp. BWB1-3]MCB5954844.1 hypothetical protein [Enterococcus sp. CWB-B31]
MHEFTDRKALITMIIQYIEYYNNERYQ